MVKKLKIDGISRLRSFILSSIPFFLAALILLLTRVAIHKPELVEKYYSKGLYPVIARLFSAISRIIPFSLWDLFWILIIILFLTGIVLVILKRVKFWWFILRLAQVLALLYSFFYFSWGFNYFRQSIDTRNGWRLPSISETEFRSVLDSLIVFTNRSFVEVSAYDYPVVDSLIEDSYKRNSHQLGLNYPNGTRHPKKMILSSYFAKSGISGYFGPFFNEVHLNTNVLPLDYPFLLAHEKAHQFGITSEAEANLVAYIICSTSGDQRLRCSGDLMILLYFLNNASHLSDYHVYIQKINKPVLEFIQFRYKYYDEQQNKTLEKVQSAANDVYLKTNHIKSGIKNYNQVVSLVISWYKNSGFIK